MFIRTRILIDKKILSLQLDVLDAYKINCLNYLLEFPDKITDISITKDLIIIITEDRDFREGADDIQFVKNCRKTNNINAYDWQGNHLWNIGEIIGDVQMACFGGGVTTSELLENAGICLDVLYNGEHNLYSCSVGGVLYVIDLNDRKILSKLSGFR